MIINNVGRHYGLRSLFFTISQTILFLKYGMFDWEKVNLALLEQYSANLQVNIPQSDPFICWGIFFAIICFQPDMSRSDPFFVLCSSIK